MQPCQEKKQSLTETEFPVFDNNLFTNDFADEIKFY